MDCFYAAVHMRDDPTLAGRPVVVGGDPLGRGVVAAASYEARRFGIHSAMPAAQARRRCPEAVFLRPDFARYERDSQAIFALYREVTPLVETLSLDEAYLDVTEHLGHFGSATAIAHHLRRRVRDECRLTVSVGVGPNKLVAKIASDFNKPDGLTVVKPHQVVAFLSPLPARRLYGGGSGGPPPPPPPPPPPAPPPGPPPAATPLDLLLAHFGQWGRTLWEHAHGVDRREVQPHHERKSLSTERTFAADLAGRSAIDPVVTAMAAEVAEGLEERQLAASTVIVKVRYADFTTVTRTVTLEVPTASPATITAAALGLLERTAAGERAVRLLGVGAAQLVPCRFAQPPLFADAL